MGTDHIAGLPYYLSQRYFQGMKPGTVLIPVNWKPPSMQCSNAGGNRTSKHALHARAHGGGPDSRNPPRFWHPAYATHHGGVRASDMASSASAKSSSRNTIGKPTRTAQMRKEGVEIQYRLECPRRFLGDTTAGDSFRPTRCAKRRNPRHRMPTLDPPTRKGQSRKHLHIEAFIDLLPKLKNKWIISSHVSRRTGVRRAKRMLTKRTGLGAHEEYPLPRWISKGQRTRRH